MTTRILGTAEQVMRDYDQLDTAGKMSVAAHTFSVACKTSDRGARHIIDRVVAIRLNGEDEADLMRRLNPKSSIMQTTESWGVDEW